LGLPGEVMGAHWGLFADPWELPRSSWGAFGRLAEGFGHSWALLGASWELRGSSLVALGLLVLVGMSLGSLLGIPLLLLNGSSVLQMGSPRILGDSWGSHGGSLGTCGCSVGRLLELIGNSLLLLGSSFVALGVLLHVWPMVLGIPVRSLELLGSSLETPWSLLGCFLHVWPPAPCGFLGAPRSSLIESSWSCWGAPWGALGDSLGALGVPWGL
jgi:hypothetical protein